MTDSPAPGLHLQPMVHVQQMEPAVAFYEALGATVLHGSRDGDFVMLRIGDSQLGLLAHPPNPEQNEGAVELNFRHRRRPGGHANPAGRCRSTAGPCPQR